MLSPPCVEYLAWRMSVSAGSARQESTMRLLRCLLAASALQLGYCFVQPNAGLPSTPRMEPGPRAYSRAVRLFESKPSSRAGAWETTGSPVKFLVSALTDGLNVVTGLTNSAAATAPAQSVAPRAAIRPEALLKKVQEDYTKRTYFLTGVISDEAYDEDCVFTDPTISFAGLQTWKRNLASLTIFVKEPQITLYNIKLDKQAQTITTEWRLSCVLGLPWRPCIEVDGGTVHRYDPSRGGRIVSHVETWQLSAYEALALLFKPFGRPSSPPSSMQAKSTPQVGKWINGAMRAAWPLAMGLLASAPLSESVARRGDSYVAQAVEDKRQVGEIQASGLIFKDTINVEAFKDPKVKGVTLYVSDFRRPLTERITKDFFSDPSQTSVACVRTGPVTFDKIDMSKSGEEVFSEARSLLFKTVRVRRLYDADANALIYVSFSTRFDKNDDANKSRFKSSICAVPLYDNEVSATGAAP